MVIFTDRVSFRAGATPQTFDGGQTFRINSKGRRLLGVALGSSMSAHTTDEGAAMAIKLSNNENIPKPIFLPMGHTVAPGPATNSSVKFSPVDFMPLDIKVEPNTTIQLDISTVVGATQTGTWDVVVTLLYDDGSTPADIVQAMLGRKGIVALKGGSYGYSTAITTTAETALTGNGTPLNIPAFAKEIVGIVAIVLLDTAVTAAEEIGGHVRLELGLDDDGKQEYPLNGGQPPLGTEVEGGGIAMMFPTPMYIPLPSREIQASAFVTFLSAVTGGADVAVFLLWR